MPRYIALTYKYIKLQIILQNTKALHVYIKSKQKEINFHPNNHVTGILNTA